MENGKGPLGESRLDGGAQVASQVDYASPRTKPFFHLGDSSIRCFHFWLPIRLRPCSRHFQQLRMPSKEEDVFR